MHMKNKKAFISISKIVYIAILIFCLSMVILIATGTLGKLWDDLKESNQEGNDNSEDPVHYYIDYWCNNHSRYMNCNVNLEGLDKYGDTIYRKYLHEDCEKEEYYLDCCNRLKEGSYPLIKEENSREYAEVAYCSIVNLEENREYFEE